MLYIYRHYFENKNFDKQINSVESMIGLTNDRLIEFKKDIENYKVWDKENDGENKFAYCNIKSQTSRAELKATMHLLRKELIRLDKML